MLFVVGLVVLVGGRARGPAAGARAALAARAELLAHAARCNTPIAHIRPPALLAIQVSVLLVSLVFI